MRVVFIFDERHRKQRTRGGIALFGERTRLCASYKGSTQSLAAFELILRIWTLLDTCLRIPLPS